MIDENPKYIWRPKASSDGGELFFHGGFHTQIFFDQGRVSRKEVKTLGPSLKIIFFTFLQQLELFF